MSSKHLLEDWLKLCDDITYFNYGSQSILAMNLLLLFAIMVALCWKNMFKLCPSIPGEGGPHWRNITT